MPIKKKADIAALANLTEDDRADLTSLFDAIEERNGQISDLRKKAGDADEVAKKNKDLEKLLGEKSKLSEELQEKLNKLTTNAPVAMEPNFDDLGPFAELRKDLLSFFDDTEPEAES
jgi:predicted RNase H-like nuclease (RuvC/YqgF family)